MLLAAIAVALAVSASPTFAQMSVPAASAARAQAIRECNTSAQKYALYTWGNLQLYVYRACMAQHRQAE
jgi:hypothetical protein